ncbi:BsuBI/PstI family type II restriction endonuclease [Bradyrhizobium sp. A5]|uniref:BsuBI/PstI family type II restriction endonuclease n=1 Tax=Bradyrhizobium sp. A5 TaxID=3133696 RepID=UPI00324AB769
MHGSLPVKFLSTAAWVQWLDEQLRKPEPAADAPVVLDLFAGCGGLALGFEAAGFRTVGYEMASAPVRTYNANLVGSCHERQLDIGDELGKFDVVIGGPPCQPFSQIGYQRGRHDDRDGFPIFLDVVRRSEPRLAIIENVRGLLFRNKDYLKQVVRELERFGYAVDTRLLNTVDFGVPQKRQRVVIVASKCGWEWPEHVTNHPVTVGVALGDLATKHSEESRFLTPSMDKYIAAYEAKSACVRPRDLHLNQPARTLTCRNLFGATSDMVRVKLPDGRRRMLHLEEAARLQSFPSWFKFEGTEAEQFEQIGNSVAPLMSLAIGRAAMRALRSEARPMKRVSAMFDQMEFFVPDDYKEKVEQAQNILRQVGVPLREETPRRRERVAKALLAVAGIRPGDPWTGAKSLQEGFKPLKTRDIIRIWNDEYGEAVADSSYDDVRRKDLKILVAYGLVASSAADPHADTNDGTRGYALSEPAVPLLRAYGSEDWENKLITFRAAVGEIADRLSRARQLKAVPVKLPDGQVLNLSSGAHNELQKAIVEQLLPRHAPGAELLYLGDANQKMLFVHKDRLEELRLPQPSRDTLPDVVAFDNDRNCLFYIEAVSSFGPISDIRREELRTRAHSKGMNHPIIFITAFPDRKTFAGFSQQIGWETEVWIANNPDHMIHFNGDKYLSPYTE